MSYDDESIAEEWIAQMLSTASSDTLATLLMLPGGDVLLDPQSGEGEEPVDQEIVVTGKRLTYDYGGSTGGGTDGGGGSGGTLAAPVAVHPQDCGTEDGADRSPSM